MDVMDGAIRMVALVAVCLLMTPPAQAAEYMVDTNNPVASDSGPGNAQIPFKTILKGVKHRNPGDTVTIRAGLYREWVKFTVEGTFDRPITIQAAPGDEGKVVIMGSDLVTNWKREHGVLWSSEWKYKMESNYPADWDDYGAYGHRCEMVFVDGEPLKQVLAKGELARGTFFVDENAGRIYIALRKPSDTTGNVEVATRQLGVSVEGQFVKMRGLTVKYVPNDYKMAAFNAVCNNSEFRDIRAEWNNLDGLRFVGRQIQAVNNTAVHNGRCGISASIYDCLLEGNRTDDNSWRFGPEWHAGGMKIVGEGPSNNRIIRHVSNNNNGRGIWFDYNCRNNRVENCVMDNNLIAGLEFEACNGPNWAVNNVISRTRIWRDSLTEQASGAGIVLYESNDTRIYNNTVVGNERCGLLLAGGARKISYDKTETYCAQTQIYNNIFADNGESVFRFWVWDRSAAPGAVESHRGDYNLFFLPKRAFMALLPADKRAVTLADWREAFKQDAHSIEADPLFANPAKQDYRLRSESPVIGAGTALSKIDAVAGVVEEPGKPVNLGALSAEK